MNLTASEARIEYYMHTFEREHLRQLSDQILEAARRGEMGLDTSVLPAKRNAMFDLLESHGYHYHSKNPETLRICWNWQCRVTKIIDDTLVPGFPRGDRMYHIAIASLTNKHWDAISQIEAQVRMAMTTTTNIKLEQDIHPEIHLCLCYPQNGYTIHSDKRTVCWQWTCMDRHTTPLTKF